MKKSISRLQLTYIFSYMLIFLVPFSIMSSIFYYNSVTSLREEIELTNLHNLEIIRKLTDGHIRELGKIGALISNDAKLTQYMVSKQNFWPDAIAELKKYKENSSIISDIYLYYFNQKEVFSADGMMSVDTFLEYRSSLDVSDKDLFIREISTSIHPFISTNLTIFEDNPTYLYPLPAGPVQSYGAVLMKLDEYFFADMIKKYFREFRREYIYFRSK